MAEPVVGLLREFGDGMRGEKFRCAPLRRSFFGDGLDAVFAVFVEGAVAVGIRPGAAGTVGAIELIEVSEGSYAVDEARFPDRELQRFQDGSEASGDVRRGSDADGIGFDWRLGSWGRALAGAVIEQSRVRLRLEIPHDFPSLRDHLTIPGALDHSGSGLLAGKSTTTTETQRHREKRKRFSPCLRDSVTPWWKRARAARPGEGDL
jgi:hypothetical protein